MSGIASIALAFALTILLTLNGTDGVPHLGDEQRLTLWAWERSERLTFLPADTAVAFLAGSIDLNAEPVFKPRFQPLHVDERTPLIAVVRLEITPSTPMVFTERYRAIITGQILNAADLPRVRGLQIDFDATSSQREFYREVLTEVRSGLPPNLPLSITALASWCLGDDWISDLPIDEAVPMLFRMGRDRTRVLEALRDGRDFSERLCRSSIGVSMDEPWPVSLLSRRVYVFSPHAWTSTSYADVQKRLQP